MDSIKNGLLYFLSFKSYVVLPVIIFILGLVFRMKITEAVRSALQIGFGFIGIFMCFDFFVSLVNPVVKALIARSGLSLSVLDTGWPPLAAVAWSFQLVPVLMGLFLLINIVMLVLRLTKTVDIDIWNYWHVLFAGAMIYQVTGNVWITIAASLAAFVIVLKLAEWSAPLVNKISGMNGICIPHLAAIAYFPPALAANWLFDRLPGFNKLDADPEKLKARIGIFGEPMTIGLVMGIALGIGAGYNIKQLAELAMGFAAVVFILPKMCAILGSALIPLSEQMKVFIGQRFPKLGITYIGLDVAVLFGLPTVMVTSVLLIPVSILFAFVLPGIRFIPLGDLTNLVVPMALIATAVKGNMVRAFILGIPMVIGNLYIASALAPLFTKMAATSNYHIAGYDGVFTSYLDGGQFFRAWWLGLFTGDLLSLLLVPVAVLLLVFTWKSAKQGGSVAKAE